MRCKYILKSGLQCSRETEPGSEYCWQHKKFETQKIVIAPAPEKKLNAIDQKYIDYQNRKNGPVIPPKLKLKSEIPKPKSIIPAPPVPERKVTPFFQNFNVPKISRYSRTRYSPNFSYAILLNFESTTLGKASAISLPLLFDSNNKFISGTLVDQLQTIFFHLIRRATQRLALHTTNKNLKDTTELTSISVAIPEKNDFEIIETIPIEEERLYTKTEALQVATKTAFTTLFAPVVTTYGAIKGIGSGLILGGTTGAITGAKGGKAVLGAVGSVAGGVTGGVLGAIGTGVYKGVEQGIAETENLYQKNIGDRYVSVDDKKLFENGVLQINDNITAKIPFEFLITDLPFPDSGLKNETYTLWIVGEFLDVQLATNTKIPLPANVDKISISNAQLLTSGVFRDTIKSIKRKCTNSKTCMYFEPEI